VGFSGDGRELVTVAEDQTVRLWDALSGSPVSPKLVAGGPIASASLSADGRRLTVRSRNGDGRVWDLTPDERPAADLVYLTELLAGQSLDGKSGTFEPVAATNLRNTWLEIRDRYPHEFRPSPR
jgi:WD40 repeat protein